MTKYVDIQRFDMSRIKPGSVVLVLGDRGTGKTIITKEILYNLRDYPMGVVMAGSLDTVDEYKQHVPNTLIYDEYVPELVTKLQDEQEKRLHQVGKARLPPVFLLLDDLMFDKNKINNDTFFKKAIFNGRHFNITIIIVAQYVKHISAELRPQADYIFTTYQKNSEQRRKIRMEFDVGFPNDNVFHATMLACTKDWSCMVLDKHSMARDGIHQSVFHCKAQLHRKFRVGSANLWAIHDKRYNPKYYDRNSRVDPTPRFVIRKVRNLKNNLV